MLEINGVVGGTYQVIREIGHGGTGVVYLAYHLNLRKYIVLKRITAQITNMESLRREADILKNLRHTNIPQIYDFLIENGEVFTVMDYIEGQSLDNYICGANQYSEDRLLFWFRELTAVLVYLQSRKPSVIHSDIKPANIIITPQGIPVLIDFNISLDNNPAGIVAGYSRYYASPEQIYMAQELMAGRNTDYRLDGRTDIFSLGAVFYALMTGVAPDSCYELPKLETMQGLIYSTAFRSVIDKCTEWDRNQRFKNASKLSSAVTYLYRMDRTYRRYTLIRSLSWILSAIIFASGCFCILHGAGLNDRDKALELYRNAAQFTELGDFTSAGEAADEVLNNRRYYSRLTDTGKAELYHISGDAAYVNGNFSYSAENYEKAVELLNEGSEQLPGYCSDLAIAYLRSGNLSSLKELSDEVRQKGIENADMELIEAAALQEAGDLNGCLKITDSIIGGDNATSVKAKACVLASQCYEDKINMKLKYMRKAVEYSDEMRYVRECAALEYIYAGKTGISDSERRDSALRAVKLYEKLCKTPAPQTTDMINLGISYYYAGLYQESIDILTSLSKSTNDYRVSMYLALSAEQTGDRSTAIKYCTEALDACMKQNTADAENDLEVLRSLSDRLF